MKKIIVLGLFAAAFFIGGCAATETVEKRVKISGDDIIAPGLLRGAGLGIDWQHKIPLNPNESVRVFYVATEYVYIITENNLVLCYDRFDGNLRFVRQLARANLPVMEPVEYNGAVYTVVGNELWKINPETATVSMLQTLENGAVAPIVMTNENIYVSGLDNRIQVYDREGGWHKFQLSARNDSEITTMLVEGEYMWFATKEGNIYCASSYAPIRYWTFNASAQISGAIAKNDRHIFVSGADTTLYKLSAMTGSLMWKKPLGSALLGGPILIDDIVYQYSRLNGIYAVDIEQGEILWQEPNGKSFAAKSGSNVYIFTDDNLLSVMSNQNGESKFKVNFAPVERCAKNIYDDNIYILSKDGKLAKISEID